MSAVEVLTRFLIDQEHERVTQMPDSTPCPHDPANPKHREHYGELDRVMEELPDSQGGPSRLRVCPYCAYQRGWEDARKWILNPEAVELGKTAFMHSGGNWRPWKPE